MGNTRAIVVAPFVVALLVSSSLLFLVQPMVAKMVLPLLGGAPSVWTTSILFFQATLLLGYAYAHFVVARLDVRGQAVVHLAVILLPLLVLPIGLPEGWSPPREDSPLLWLLALLGVVAGLPFFVVSSSGPLLQRWFAGTGRRDPYFLFAASNAGSLLGLLAYPLIVERTLSLHDQARLWSAGYILLIALTAACALTLRRTTTATPPTAAAIDPIARARRVRWVVLAFVPSSLMLGATAQITSEVAPVPLLWVIGLALYLITLIVAFALRDPRPPRLLVNALPMLVAAVLILTFLHPTRSPWVLLLDLIAFFVAALVCHGQLAADRPDSSRLTEFYFWLALGGALGGVFNGLIAPTVFSRVVEFPWVLLFALALRPRLLVPERFWARPRGLAAIAFVTFIGAAVVTTAGQTNVLHVERSFFAVHKVQRLDRWGGHFHSFVNGNTIHGLQSVEPGRERQPLLYFHRAGPIGQVFTTFRRGHPAARVGVVGLGIGSLACYARAEDRWTFFEIDAAVVRIARDPELFSLLRRCAPSARIVLGDGRRSLERQPPGGFDLLVMDAFNSESLPVHLITREALAIYRRALAPGGVLVFNASNHTVDIVPVLGALAADAGLTAVYRDDERDIRSGGRAPSRWIVMARNPGDLGDLPHARGWRPLTAAPGDRVWTDQYSNVLSVLRW